MIVLLSVLLGCRDAEMAPLKDALDDYERGRALADAGDWGGAANAFAQAIEDHPPSPALHMWWAKALAEQGQFDKARDALTQGIERVPEHPLLHYNRAAYAARGGDLGAAARGLNYLYARGMMDPVIAGEDPDFAALAVEPRYAHLAPAPALQLEVQMQEPSVLIGDRFTAELQLRTRVGAPISIDAPTPTTASLVHERTIEDQLPDEAGWSQRRLTIRWLAAAVGEQALGPVTAKAHGSEGKTSPMVVSAAALP
ncbi:MAG: tetratricopeptide repeat protein, partial [Myxococcota bacterium]